MSDDTIKQDFYSKVDTVLTTNSLWNGVGFTTYRDFDMEGMTSEPARPFIFIGSRNTAVIPKYLPYIILDIELDRYVFQMGSTSTLVRVSINILGRTEGEASRIASVLKDNVVTFGSYNAQQQTDTQGKAWSEQALPIPEPAWSEGTLRQLLSISSEFIVM